MESYTACLSSYIAKTCMLKTYVRASKQSLHKEGKTTATTCRHSISEAQRLCVQLRGKISALGDCLPQRSIN
eukprot:scaffold204395_cov27-Prasinocladus_malaysianus.AAC.1